MDSKSSHVREHHSVLAAAEERLLVAIARRLPQRITSDHLSLLALASLAIAGMAFAVLHVTAWASLAVVMALLLNWLGDSLDGTVARVRNQQRPRYGYYIDHVIDIAGTACMLAGLAASPLMTPVVAVALLAAYLLVSAEAYLMTHAAGVFRMSFLGFGPTELRIVLAAGVLRAAWNPWLSFGVLGNVRLFDLGGALAIAGLIFAFVVSAIRNGRALYRAEPLPSGANVATLPAAAR